MLREAATAAQEQLIAADSALPATERRVFAPTLTAVARSMEPGRRPPMFFEAREADHPARRGPIGSRRANGRRRP